MLTMLIIVIMLTMLTMLIIVTIAVIYRNLVELARFLLEPLALALLRGIAGVPSRVPWGTL